MSPTYMYLIEAHIHTGNSSIQNGHHHVPHHPSISQNLFENGDRENLYLGEILRQPHWLHSWAPRLSRGRPRSGQITLFSKPR